MDKISEKKCNEDIRRDIALVVLSCDKYSELWEQHFEALFRFWPDCPYQVYLFSNEKDFEHDRVRTILSGPDKNWSKSIKTCVEQLSHSRLFFMLDDVFLTSKVETAVIERLVNDAIAEDANFFKFRPSVTPDLPFKVDFGIIPIEADYRTTLFLTLWKKDVFLSLLKDGETAWAFETTGTERSREMEGFYSVWDKYFDYIHLIENGLYIKEAVIRLKNQGITLDTSVRGIISPWEIKYLPVLIKYGKKIIDVLPEKRAEVFKNFLFSSIPVLRKFKKPLIIP